MPKVAPSSGAPCPAGRVGLLFSGGLDSTVLAALAVEAGARKRPRPERPGRERG